MKKLLLGAAIFGALAMGIPAQAAPGNGCTALGEGDAPAHECTYKADGAGNFAAATPNGWEIYVIRVINDVETKVILATGELGPPSSGAIASAKNEVVHVWIDRDCAPGNACGNLGFVAAFETA